MSSQTSPEEQRQHFQSLLEDLDTIMLITHSKDGQIRARPVAIADHDASGRLTFVTSYTSGKVDELLSDDRACVVSSKGRTWLSLSGSAHVATDAKDIDRIWKSAWSAWFKHGKEDPDVALIYFVPNVGEYWDQSGLSAVAVAWEQLRARRDGEVAHPEKHTDDTHAKVKL